MNQPKNYAVQHLLQQMFMAMTLRNFICPSKKLVKTGIFVVIPWICTLSQPVSCEEFKSEKFKISLNYDSSLMPTDVKLHNVALALKSKTSNFPTFNVIIESGKIDLTSPRTIKEKAMIDSYKLVGIKDVLLLNSSEESVNNQPVFKTELSYSLDNNKMVSYVALFSGADRRYILTFIDTVEGFKNSKKLAEQTISSFRMYENSQTGTNPRILNLQLSTQTLLTVILVIVVVLVITLKLMRRKHHG